MSFLARLLGRNGDGAACSAKGGGVPPNGKRAAPSSPASGSFAPEFAGGRQAPAVAVKLQSGAPTHLQQHHQHQQQHHHQQQRPSLESDEDDSSIRVPGSLSSCHDRNRSNSLARRRAAIDISPRAVQRLADKVAVLDAGQLCTAGECAVGGVTRAEVDALYSDMQLIHRGRCAMVYRAREVRTSRRVILKAYDAGALANGTRRAALERQVLTLRAAQAASGTNCGLVQLERVVENPAGTFLVLQACNGGTLIEAIANAGGKLPERQVAIKVALPLLGALAQLHGAGIVHRDIKPEHLMIHNGNLRVGDFGAAGCMTAAAAASASQLQHEAAVALQHRAHQQHQQQQKQQQQQADAQHAAAADAAAGDQQQLDQQHTLSQLQALQQQALQVQADCTDTAQPQPSTFDKHKRLSDHSQHRLGSQLLAEVDTLAAVASGPLAPPPVVDAMNFRIGSIEYCAPEMLNKPTPAEVFHLVIAQGIDEDDLPTYDAKVDVWAAGVVVYEALSGLQPFLADSAADMCAVIRAKLTQEPDQEQQQPQQQQQQHGRRHVPPFIARLPVSADARDFLAACLEWDPAQRPSAAELAAHPWLRRMQEEAAAVALSRANSRRLSMRLSRDGASASAAAAAAGGMLPPPHRPLTVDVDGASPLSLVDPVVASMLTPNSLDISGGGGGLERSYTSEQLELGARNVLRTATQRLDGCKAHGARVHAA